jgi:hypothetical protein
VESYKTKPVAGDAMALRWVVVIRGGRNPLVVLSACKIALASIVIEVPTRIAATLPVTCKEFESLDITDEKFDVVVLKLPASFTDNKFTAELFCTKSDVVADVEPLPITPSAAVNGSPDVVLNVIPVPRVVIKAFACKLNSLLFELEIFIPPLLEPTFNEPSVPETF